MHDIGFMQGRLSPMIDGKIQAFPWDRWQDEFPRAQQIGIKFMEWTLDRERLSENPLMTKMGRKRIAELSHTHDVRVNSLTGDIFMQAPFWRADGEERTLRLRELDAVIDACAATSIRFIVIPLVDSGAMQSAAEEEIVIGELLSRATRLRRDKLYIVFECDYEPNRLAQFIAKLPDDAFGINYDIGNSAALDYDCNEEIASYGHRIKNVHIKDRLKGGTTVALGTGNADLPRAIKLVVKAGYQGAFILQTARAQDGSHSDTLRRYLDLSRTWIEQATK